MATVTKPYQRITGGFTGPAGPRGVTGPQGVTGATGVVTAHTHPPAGPDRAIQFSDNGVLAGEPWLTWWESGYAEIWHPSWTGLRIFAETDTDDGFGSEMYLSQIVGGIEKGYDFYVWNGGELYLWSSGTDGDILRFTADGRTFFNPWLEDLDFTVAGDTEAYLLHTDASTDRVGIGTNTPTQKLDVNGSTRVRGNLATNGALDVDLGAYIDGAVEIYGATYIDDSVQVTQGLVVNSILGNFDTQIKGDTDPNLLYADASTDRVGIGTNAPQQKLHVVGAIRVDATNKIEFYDANYWIRAQGGLELNSGDYIQFEIGGTQKAKVDAAGLTVTGAGTFTGAVGILGQLTVDNALRVINQNGTDTFFNYVDSNQNYIRGTNTQIETPTSVNGNLSIDNGHLIVTNPSPLDVTAFNYLDGGDNYIRGNTTNINSAVYATHPVTLNSGAGDVDTVIRGDTDNYLFVTDASTDRVGIGTATPGYKLDVAGTIRITATSEQLLLNNVSAGQQSQIWFQDGGAAKWVLLKHNDNSFQLYNYAAGREDVIVTSATHLLNASGADQDIQVKGDTDANLLFTDASTDRVGIGASDPQAKLDVNGGLNVRNPSNTTHFNYAGGGDNYIRGATQVSALAGSGSRAVQADSAGNLSASTDVGSLGSPPGIISPYAGLGSPSGWLLCDGSSVSRATYAALWGVMNISKGSFTVTIASPGVFTLNSHGLVVGDAVYLTTVGTLPTGLVANTTYYVHSVPTANTFTLTTGVTVVAITTSGTQLGTHFLILAPYGIPAGSTTNFLLPDLQGRSTFGKQGANVSIGPVTITIASPGVVTQNQNSLALWDAVMFTTTGALPTGISPGVTYYVSGGTLNTITLAATVGGATINTSGTQSGTHQMTRLGPHRGLGAAGGIQNLILQTSEMPPHTHGFTDNYNVYAGAAYAGGGFSSNDAQSSAADTTASTGGGAAHTNMPPYLTTNYIIKT